MGLTTLGAPCQDLILKTVSQTNTIVKYDPVNPAGPGLCQEILRAVERVDPGLRFTGLGNAAPLKRIEQLLVDGEVDVFFCLLKSPYRERLLRFLPVPLYTVREVVAQRADDRREFTTLDALAEASRNKPVLITRGTTLMRRLEEAQVPFSQVGSEREALQMLMLGRTDAIYGQDLHLLRYIRETQLGGQIRLGRTSFGDRTQFVAVRADLPLAQQERLLQALRKLERDGVLRQLAEKYR